MPKTLKAFEVLHIMAFAGVMFREIFRKNKKIKITV